MQDPFQKLPRGLPEKGLRPLVGRTRRREGFPGTREIRLRLQDVRRRSKADLSPLEKGGQPRFAEDDSFLRGSYLAHARIERP